MRRDECLVIDAETEHVDDFMNVLARSLAHFRASLKSSESVSSTSVREQS